MSSVNTPSSYGRGLLDRVVLPVVMRWDYGDERRGRSCEDAFFVENLRAVVRGVEPVWIDDHLADPKGLMSLVDRAIERHRPDLVFLVPFRDEFTRAMLDSLRERVPTLAWFCDDEWRFDSFTRHLAPHYSWVCTTDPMARARYAEIGVEPILTAWAGQLVGPDLGPTEDGFEHDVTFVGGLDPNRAWFLRQLRRHGIQVEHFGAGSPHGRIEFDEMEHVFRTSRINLNLSNSRNTDIRFATSSPRAMWTFLRSAKGTEQIKARNFEIPLAGGFQLTNYVPGLERHFTVGHEVAAYGRIEDCVRQVHRYLTDDAERITVARRGYERASLEHTYVHRFRDILSRVWGR